jgi:hypothetical protein
MYDIQRREACQQPLAAVPGEVDCQFLIVPPIRDFSDYAFAEFGVKDSFSR